MLIYPECFEPDFVRGAEADFARLLSGFDDRTSKELLRTMIQKVKVGCLFRLVQKIDMRPLLLGNSNNLLAPVS